MDAEEVGARASIQALVIRCASLGDRGRVDDLLDLLTDEAEITIDDHGSRTSHAGRDEISALYRPRGGDPAATGDAPAFFHHCISTHDVTLEGDDAATGRAYFVVLTPRGSDHWGRYLDRYTRSADGWRIAARRIVVDGSADRARARNP